MGKGQGEQIERRWERVECCNTFKDENGTEVKIELKTECSTQEEMRKTLSFIAQSSHRFYLEVADKINSTL